jgi:hypothetical protein
MQSNFSDCEAILQGFNSLQRSSCSDCEAFFGRIVCEMLCKGRGLRDRNVLTAERFCKGLTTCEIEMLWLQSGTNLVKTRFQGRDRSIKFALGLLTVKVESLIEIEAQKSRPSIKLTLELLIARLDWEDKIRSNALCESDLILPRSNDWLRLKRIDRQSASFFVAVCYRLLICDHWSVLIYLYDRSTIHSI